MKCPECKKEGCKYIEPRRRLEFDTKEPVPRDNFQAICKKCGFSGIA